MSQITTHILDTTSGKPATGVTIILYAHESDWIEIAKGVTNKDGRITDLLPVGEVLPKGMYKMKFATKGYFDALSIETLYPFVEIIFSIAASEHYHIPLLLNPFGYTTYRGS
ncbi:hydroxyisourate hydrolase [Segetibacter aerophilus]|uniref:5-hydroxyisourate hydrolase n=1 Tax=Segetibacter aerophilus TaxID=670293 RepID=A0A512BAN7_9BACT|nr:hydroxyisourate hydrolase [Segetibacter aerophilus]GEO08985.1 5-hydroxyisourate hydrolase [Segetibacter aerophilus]